MSRKKLFVENVFLCVRVGVCECLCDDTLTDYFENHSHRRALVSCLHSVFSDIKKEYICFVDSTLLLERSFSLPRPPPQSFLFVFPYFYLAVCPSLHTLFFPVEQTRARELLFDLFPINWCSGI